MNLLKWIDYIWFVGESFQKQENSPGDGETLLMWGWYLNAVLPLWSFICRLGAGWIFNVVILVVLLAVPFLFCRWRYNRSRSHTILSQFHCKHPGRKLLLVWIIIICVACIEGVLMLYWGLWTNNYSMSGGFSKPPTNTIFS